MHHMQGTTRIVTAVLSIGITLLLCNRAGIAAEADDGLTYIQIDSARVLARGVDRKLGICLNFTIDRNDHALREALQKLGVSAIRFQEGELGDNWHFDVDEPERPVLGVTDPKIWYHRSKTDGQRWRSTLTPAGFLDLAATRKLDAYSIVGIDSLVYDGSAPHLTRDEVIASASAFVRFARSAADLLGRSQPVIQYWEIGNENDLQGMLAQFDLGHSWNAAEYAHVAAELATHMKRADSRIQVGVNGMTPKSNWWQDVLTAEVTVAGQSKRLPDLIDFLITHQYSWVANYGQWRDAGADWEYARNVAAAVNAARRFAPGKPIAVTEWSAYSPSRKGDKDHANNAWHAIHNLQMLGEILKHETVTHACFWTTRWSSNANKLHNALSTDGGLTPVGESLRFWSEFVKPDLVEADHAGSICVYATRDRRTDQWAIFLLNRSDRARLTQLGIAGAGERRVTRIDHLCATGDDPMASTVERRNGGTGSTTGANLLQFKLPPVSATVISLRGPSPQRMKRR